MNHIPVFAYLYAVNSDHSIVYTTIGTFQDTKHAIEYVDNILEEEYNITTNESLWDKTYTKVLHSHTMRAHNRIDILRKEMPGGYEGTLEIHYKAEKKLNIEN